MKKLVILIIVIIIVAGVFFFFQSQRTTVAPEEETVPTEVITENIEEIIDLPEVTEEATEENTAPEAINAELEGLDLGNIEGELQGIDADLSEL
jgi:hypothetical protein